LKSSGFLYALVAAVLFGASAPLAKLFLSNIGPWALAGILYLGAGAGLLVLFVFRSLLFPSLTRAPLDRKDLLPLAGLTFSGGILAPIFLMNGLARSEAAESSLLLNLETVFTVGLAWFVFREPFNRRVVAGMALILAGAILLSWPQHALRGGLWGPLFVGASCFCWAVDNNITRMISEKDPLQIAAIKSLVAGATNVTLALGLHGTIPRASLLASAAGMGFLCYGVSLCFFILALRYIGTARTSAFFSIAPFVGTLLSVLLLGESFSPRLFGVGLLMGVGVWIYMTEERRPSFN
jgi:drug/metabolite transporter (DMT)-like permease